MTRQRAIAAGDQQVDALVVELLEDFLGTATKAVVEGREAVEQNEGRPVDRNADDLPRVAAVRRQDHQDNRSGERKHGPDQMRPGVEFFSIVHDLLFRVSLLPCLSGHPSRRTKCGLSKPPLP